MKRYRPFFIVGALCLLAPQLIFAAAGPGSAFTGSISDYYDCKLNRGIEANYTAVTSKYHMRGTCEVPVPGSGSAFIYWDSQQGYSATNGKVIENITLTGNPPLPSIRLGKMQVLTFCNSDPWINAASCNQQPQVSGDFHMEQVRGLYHTMVSIVMNKRYPLTADFAYDRQPLIAKRNADLNAQAAALAEQERRNRELAAAAGQKPAPLPVLMSPTVQSPTAGQRFLNQTPIPIKLAPPKSWNVSGYMVNLQRKNNSNQWIAHGAFPVGAVQAHSAGGYTGFGAGAPPTFLSAPGAWRINAQVSSPKQSGWSDWVEFDVMAPPASNKSNALKPGISGFK